jgi:hypothetical protein
VTDHEHDELRRKFDALRAKLEGDAPPFQPMWNRAVAEADALPRWRRHAVPLIAAAAVVVVVVGISFAQFGGTGEPQVAADSAATGAQRGDTTVNIGNWRAPTDVLLRYSGREFLGTPKLGGSEVDRFIPDSKLIKGD